ncbi:MAG: hypothetical protein MUF02_08425, partial [Acidobacteria bacterium]|nr:hypothetical protein [Acidobacteriota bacterium]
MKKSHLLALFLACGGLLLAVSPRADGREGPMGPDVPVRQDREAASDRKEIRVPAGETRSAAINAFNARLDVRGKLDESVFLLGGSLRLEGEVSGDVICIASEVEILDGALIGRDLIVIGGRLLRADGSRVNGRVYDVRSRQGMRRMAASLLPFLPESGGMTFFKVIKIFFWLVLSLLALAVFPVPVTQAAAWLCREPLRHLGRGAATLLLFALLLLLFLLLSFVFIGIPLLVVLLAAFFLLLIFGRAVVFYFLGERILGALKLRLGAAFFIVTGIAAYTLLKFVPVVGWMFLVLLDFFAVGIATG